MSYGKFLDDCNQQIIRRSKSNLPSLSMEGQFAIVRDQWINDGRYKELIAFILENWDAGNCDDFSRPFSRHLIGVKELDLFKSLWKGIIRNRLEKLWRDHGSLMSSFPRTTIQDIKNVKLDGYNQFSSTESILRAVAWRRSYVLDGIHEFIDGLESLEDKEEVERQTRMLAIVSSLERSV